MLWLLIANLTLTTIMFAHIVDIDRHLQRRITMATQDTINAVVAQLGKAKTELLGKIADLALQLDDAQVADKVDLSELVAVAQALDDIVPDETEEAPAETPEQAAEDVEEPQDAPPF